MLDLLFLLNALDNHILSILCKPFLELWMYFYRSNLYWNLLSLLVINYVNLIEAYVTSDSFKILF